MSSRRGRSATGVTGPPSSTGWTHRPPRPSSTRTCKRHSRRPGEPSLPARASPGARRDNRSRLLCELPAGTITLLFADIERSTVLLQELSAERYGKTLREYRRLLRDAVAEREGVEVGTEGDGFYAAFPSARQALAGAQVAPAAFAAANLSVRMGLHTGEPLVGRGQYSGIDGPRAARIAAAGHGGQVLLSQSTRELVEDALTVRSLGRHRLKDLGEPVEPYHLGE